MKCLPECGFDQLPNNGPILVLHMHDCALNGPLKNVETPIIVWRDGGFAVVRESEEGEQIYDLGYERKEPAPEAFLEDDENEETPIDESTISSGISDDGDHALN
jgi:hypothetical protein